MERCNVNSITLFSFHFLFFVTLCTPTAAVQISGNICEMIYCGQGTCKNSNTSILGFVCECNPGWKKIQTGPLDFSSCLLPNCTVNFQCGNESPAPAPAPPLLSPPPPPPSSLPPLNLTNPCYLVWCADGSCLSNGTGHTCRCNQGSANLINNTELPCFQECYLGADCDSLGLLPSTPPFTNSSWNNGSQDSQPPPSPPPSISGSAANGLLQSFWRNLGALTVIVLAATSIFWFR